MIPRRHSLRAFTLLEMMAAMAVLIMLVVLVAQIMNGATRTTGSSRQRLSADAEARMIFDRMAADFAGMVNRKDVDFLFKKNAGNDSAFFFSMAPALSPANPALTDPVALVGYRIGEDFKLERLGQGLSWNEPAPDGIVFLTFPALTPPRVPTTPPDAIPGSTLKSSSFDSYLTPGPRAAGSPFHVLGPNVLRLEFSFLLAGVGKDAVYSAPYNKTNAGNFSGGDFDNHKGLGLNDVQAIIVTIVVMDAKSRALLSEAQVGELGGKFPDAADSSDKTLAEEWEGKIRELVESGGIPKSAAAQIRVYQRMFFLNSAVN
ncbi:MAG TPA: hypothetical protein VIM61_00230 [Chthoniobacterales bacterium]